MINRVPIVLMVFNRPDLTRKVINNLSYIKPPIIYVIADGPRDEEEKIKCEQTRFIATNLSWKCEVVTFFRDENVGMVKQFKEGLDFVFSKHDRLLFLEDDHLISKSAYFYACNLLDKYSSTNSIYHINLSNLAPNKSTQLRESYFASHHFCVWGFATWKRAWESYNISMPEWEYADQKNILDNYTFNNKHRRGVKKMYDLHCKNDDPWTYDYQWYFNCMFNNGIALTPTVNLCQNIGFNRDDATHNKGNNPFNNLAREQTSEIIHPLNLTQNIYFDTQLTKIMCPSYAEIKLGSLYKILRYLKKNS